MPTSDPAGGRWAEWLPTLAALSAIVLTATAFASHVTLDFRAWTSEDARRERVVREAPVLPAIRAVDARGRNVELWAGSHAAPRAYLLTFMYTRCPTLCRAAGEEFVLLQRELQAAPSSGVRLVSLSFDPAFDDARALAGYEQRHHVDPAHWQVLAATGDRDDDGALRALLRQAGVVVIDDGLGGLSHNAAIHVVDADRRLRRIYDLADYEQALAFARTLAAAR